MVKITNISVDEFKKMYHDDCVVVCDIREPDEYNYERIIGAINQPLSSFETNDLINKLGDKKLVIHCQSGNRTQIHADKFAKLDVDEVYILDGGINAWKSAGCVTLKGEKSPLPIMRQVQIVAGGLILLGVILGSFYGHAWYLLSAFVGAGLLFAGITGYCGMANILMLLPYNRQNNCNLGCKSK